MKMYIMNTTPLLHMLKRACALLEPSRMVHVEKIKQEKKKVQGVGAGLLLLYGIYEERIALERQGIPKKNLQDATEESGINASAIEVSVVELIELLEGMSENELALLHQMAICHTAQNGKPYLTNIADLYFSISHSEEYVACVMADYVVGADIQNMKEIDRKRVAKRMLHTKENPSLSENAVSFFTCWSAKEAYVKMTGEGLSKDFRELVLDMKNEAFGVVEDTAKKQRAEVRVFSAPAGYVLAAVDGT